MFLSGIGYLSLLAQNMFSLRKLFLLICCCSRPATEEAYKSETSYFHHLEQNETQDENELSEMDDSSEEENVQDELSMEIVSENAHPFSNRCHRAMRGLLNLATELQPTINEYVKNNDSTKTT